MSGNSLETDIDRANDWYKQKRIAVVEHLHPRVKGQPGGAMFFAGAAAYDYLGCWHVPGHAHGVPLAFEAKEASDTKHFPESIPQMQKRPKLWAKHLRQMAALVDAHTIGRALAFVLVRDPAIGGCWLLHGPDLHVLAGGGKVSLRDVATEPSTTRRRWLASIGSETRSVLHRQPYLPDTSISDYSRQRAPMLAYLDLVADVFALPRHARG